jgi:protoporphyrinogen/coproporphyrinogen III oxidase
MKPTGPTFDLLVVGGGSAGLAHAFWQLRERPDLHIRVLESSPRVGGWVQTIERDGYQLELGPQGFRPGDRDTGAFLRATRLCEAVVSCSPEASRRFVVGSGMLHELPAGPLGLLRSRLFSFGAKLRLLSEPWLRSKPQHLESVVEFVARRFGKAAVPLAEALMHGIYAGDAHELEVAATLPLAVELEHEHGSVLRGLRARRRARNGSRAPTKQPLVCTFGRGMQQSVDAVANWLGDVVRTEQPVAAITRDDSGVYAVHTDAGVHCAMSVAVTAPPAKAAAMLRPLDPPLSGLLAGVPAASVASVYVGFEAAAVPPDIDGFGFLFPRGEPGRVLGTIFTSYVFPHQAPEGRALFRVMSGGSEYPDECNRDDDELARQAVGTLRRFLEIESSPVFVHVSRARAAIPQYVRGHGARLAAIRERLAGHPGLSLRGAGYRRISVVDQWAEHGSTP